jgi:hypothetical protein
VLRKRKMKKRGKRKMMLKLIIRTKLILKLTIYLKKRQKTIRLIITQIWLQLTDIREQPAIKLKDAIKSEGGEEFITKEAERKHIYLHASEFDDP